MEQHIIFEGDDRLGKTTTAERVAAALGMPYIHHSEPAAYDKPINEVFDETYYGKPHVIDRLVLSDIVYGNILRGIEMQDYFFKYRDNAIYFIYVGPRGLTPVNDAYLSLMNFFAYDDTPKHIYVNAYYALKYGERHNTTELRYLDADIISFLKNGLPSMSSEPIFTTGDIQSNTCSFASECPYYLFHSNNSEYKQITNGIGVRNKPRIMFVGEAPGIHGCGKLGIPFYGDKSGMMFRQAMYNVQLSEGNTYITNVVKCTPPGNKLVHGIFEADIRILRNEINSVQPEQIIAVGRTADSVLDSLNIRHDFIKHPAYFLRNGMHSTEYSVELLNVINRWKARPFKFGGN